MVVLLHLGLLLLPHLPLLQPPLCPPAPTAAKRRWRWWQYRCTWGRRCRHAHRCEEEVALVVVLLPRLSLPPRPPL